jgi:hypothetical protein
MYSKTPEEFDLSLALFNLKLKEYKLFLDCFNKLGIAKKNKIGAWLGVRYVVLYHYGMINECLVF